MSKVNDYNKDIEEGMMELEDEEIEDEFEEVKEEVSLKKPDDNNLDFLDLQNIINEAMAKQQSQLYKEMAELKDRQDKQDEKLSITKQENSYIREMEVKRHRAEKHAWGFVSLGDLGQLYEVSIGSKTMGKLLRLAGIAQKASSITKPLRSAISSEFAKSRMYGEYATYQYNPKKCIEKIDRWLDKESILEEFYSIDNEKELGDYINNLYDMYS